MTDYRGPNAFSKGLFKPAKPPKIIAPYQRAPSGVIRQANGPAFDNKFPKSRYRGGSQSGLVPVLEIPDTPVVPPYIASAVTFPDNSSNLLSDVFAGADGPFFAMSFWQLVDNTDDNWQPPLCKCISPGNNSTFSYRDGQDAYQFEGQSAAGDDVFWSAAVAVPFSWVNILCNVATNHADGLKVFNLYIGDTLISATVSDGNPSFNMQWNAGQFEFLFAASAPIPADIADVWCSVSQNVDFSDAAVRAKFHDGSGKPVNLGADGSTPTGVTPEFLFTGDTTTFSTNAGSGPAVTFSGAPLTNAPTSPSD